MEDAEDAALTQSSAKMGVQHIRLLASIGIYHLDTKRSNIRVQSDGTVFFLIDFANIEILKDHCYEIRLKNSVLKYLVDEDIRRLGSDHINDIVDSFFN
jgi:tRNA A-37 threonylcarbamoyl transferase component Bud32